MPRLEVLDASTPSQVVSIHGLDISAPAPAAAVISDGVCPRCKMSSRCRPVQSRDWFRVRFPEGTESCGRMTLVGATNRVLSHLS